ncbi:Delta 8-(E)-sphingolipid desaturase-like protein 2 [Elsinoe fawcettii]|nr:Delta 8-(E)-sphingolipid desaturase-like protein 2 [Elsinoe fawcettii]
MAPSNLLTVETIKARVDAGETLVIYEGGVLKLDNWLQKHPGGQLAIKHMVGRDATDQIQIYHSQEVQKRMKHFCIGRIQSPWSNLTPPIQRGVTKATEPKIIKEKDEKTCLQQDIELPDEATIDSTIESDKKESYADQIVRSEIERDLAAYPSLDTATQHAISARYQVLAKRVEDEGFYKCDYAAYGRELVRYAALFTCFFVALRYEWFFTSACFLGFFWQQIMFTAHDAGHMAITGTFVTDTVIACFIADFCCGLSMGWWKSSHNEHDPDIQNVPLLATSPSFFQSVHSSYYDFHFEWDAAADKAVPFQAYSYYPIMAIARFNLYLLSWLHLISSRSKGLGAAWWTKPLELVFMSCFWFLFGYCLLWLSIPTWKQRIMFVLVSHIITMVLHVQITLSHFAMSTANLGCAESFAQHQLRTTMDVDCPPWLDFFHGGLQFQAVHHLFPRVPRHNLRRLQVLVREFALDVGVEYKILGFLDGNKTVVGRLSDVAAQAKLFYQCQRKLMLTGDMSL